MQQFILAPGWKNSVKRHVVFWLVFSLHFIIQNLMIGGPGEAQTSRSFLESSLHFFYFLPVYIIFFYPFILWIVPKLFEGKAPWLFAILSLSLLFLQGILIMLAGKLYLHHHNGLAWPSIGFPENKYHILVNGIFVPLTLWIIAAGFKLYSYWFVQQRQNEQLANQKLATELILLKTRIHPKFLFLSLEKLQAQIASGATEASQSVLQLSELLSYILYENESNWVLLDKEIAAIKNMAALGKSTQAGSGAINIDIDAAGNPLFIAPLLLLSVIEKTFEYFYEFGQEAFNYDVSITVRDRVLTLRSMASKTTDATGSERYLADLHDIERQFVQHYSGRLNTELAQTATSITYLISLPLYSSELITIQQTAPSLETVEAI